MLQKHTCESSPETVNDDAIKSLLASNPAYASNEGDMLDDICADFVTARKFSDGKMKLYLHILEGGIHVTLISATRDLDDSEWPQHVYSIGHLVYIPGASPIPEDSDHLDGNTGLVRLDESRVLRIEAALTVFHKDVDEPYLCGCLYWHYHNLTIRRHVLTRNGRLVRCEPTGSADRLSISVYLGTALLGGVDILAGQSQPYFAHMSSDSRKPDKRRFDTLDEALMFLTQGIARF